MNGTISESSQKLGFVSFVLLKVWKKNPKKLQKNIEASISDS